MSLSPRGRRELLEFGQSIFIAAILALTIRTFAVQAFKIPTGSMIPTLKIGDHLLVNKLAYKFSEPKRGDVIVFLKQDQGKDFVKRLVGLPGETLEIREDGRLYINGKVVKEPAAITYNYKKYHWEYDPRQGPRVCYGYFTHDPQAVNVGGEVAIPPESYFVLGDNTASSYDSRYWGFVPRKVLIGKAFFIYWPPTRIGLIK